MDAKIKTLVESLIMNADTSFVGSVNDQGFPAIKAMLPPRKIDGIHAVYFSTNTSSLRVTHFRNNPKACLYFCDRRSFQGVMLQGFMEVLEDQDSKDMLWQEGDTLYYSGGVTDPDYCVLKFVTQSARLYSDMRTESFLFA